MRNRLAALKSPVNSHAKFSVDYAIPMDRKKTLRALIDERYGGNVAEFSRAIGRAPAQVHQWLSGHRKLGDAGARHIELSIPGLWQGYFDGPISPDLHLITDTDQISEIQTHYGPRIFAKVPLVSRTTAGHWDEIAGSFTEADAEDWIETTAKVGPLAFALRIRGESMEPTIPDGSIVIVDPDAEAHHRSVVVVRQNHDTEATCKRLIFEDGKPTIRPDNPAWRGQVAPLGDDANICGVVRRVEIDLD